MALTPQPPKPPVPDPKRGEPVDPAQIETPVEGEDGEGAEEGEDEGTEDK